VREKHAALYHVVQAGESFQTAAPIVVLIIRNAQRRAPGHPRVLYLDIDGHRLVDGSFDPAWPRFPLVRERRAVILGGEVWPKSGITALPSVSLKIARIR